MPPPRFPEEVGGPGEVKQGRGEDGCEMWVVSEASPWLSDTAGWSLSVYRLLREPATRKSGEEFSVDTDLCRVPVTRRPGEESTAVVKRCEAR